MDEAWQWISTLPTASNWTSPDSPLSLPLATSADHKSILLDAYRTAGSNTDTLLTFSISIHGFHPSSKTLWVSNPFPLSSPSTHLLLLLQLLQELISPSPSTPNLNTEPISAALPEAPAFLTLALICRLFWLCVRDAPADAGFLFFRTVDSSLLARALDCKTAARVFLTSVGVDSEQRFMRSLGYMLAKWCILRELQVGPAVAAAATVPAGCCPAYAVETHGVWILKGYAPVPVMTLVSGGCTAGKNRFEPEESALRYALAHQQLEAVVQLEYTVCLRDPRFIRVCVRVDNIRLHVVRLGFDREEEGDDLEGEKHFPSRVRIWMGPEVGSAYLTGPSLGRSTGNPEREVEASRTVKGSFGLSKINPGVKVKARTSARTRGRSWRWEQEAEGSAGVFEGVLCDGTTGAEVAKWRSAVAGGGMRRRYSGAGRVFSKNGGVVVAGDELPEAVSWRVGRGMEGRVLRWRVGGRVWVSYFPNQVKSGYFETRCVEWREEVDLPMVAGG